MIHIDEDKFFELLDKAVAERGTEYVYEKACETPSDGQSLCMYVDTRTGEMRPSCLVGLMLHLAGVSLETLHQNNYAPSNALLRYLGKREGLTLSPYDLVRDLFSYVQGRQDYGDTWGSIADALRQRSSYHSSSTTTENDE